ncbi:MAG: phage portal protein [Clostridiales bacterium]|nr:phage portal protein [Clostridiales bacterium]
MGLFERIFGTRSPTQQRLYTYLKGLDSYNVNFTPFGGNLFDNDISKSAIGCNARNIAKLRPVHVRKTGDTTVQSPNVRISRMLRQPNEFMTIYSFLEKVATHYFTYNNGIIYYDRENYKMYPINPSKVELLEDRQHNIYAKFQFKTGSYATIPFEDLIVIRRYFNENDYFGDKDNSLRAPMEVINTTDQGTVSAIKKSAGLLGYLKFSGNLKQSDIDKKVIDFEESYLKGEKGNGVAGLDNTTDFHKLDIKPYVPNKAQSEWSEDRIYSYLGTNKKIIQGNYTEDEWNAYYETTCEPFAIQASQVLTSVIFSDNELGHGNEIFLESNRLQYVSINSKIQVATLLTNIGAATLDQILDIFNLPQIGGEDGKRRVQTLNAVSADIADLYQLGNKNTKKKEGEENE